MHNLVNQINDNIEENTLSDVNSESFDDDLNGKNLSEFSKKTLGIKLMIIQKLKNLLEGKEYGHLTGKDMILEILGKKRVDAEVIDDILSKFSFEELEQINENKKLILKIMGDRKFNIDDFIEYGKGLGGLTREDLEQIKKNKSLILKITGDNWLFMVHLGKYGKWLGELTREDLKRIKTICRKMDKKISVSTIVGIHKIIQNSNIIKMRNFVERKEKYLKNNELISGSEFKELFGGLGKYGKGEINQKGLGYCYFYTALELLKKMNFFEVLVRTNLKQSENGNGWYIRLPMLQSDGKWIYISKNEIDKKFDVPDEDGGIRKQLSINSDSSLGFKILEIGYIKKSL